MSDSGILGLDYVWGKLDPRSVYSPIQFGGAGFTLLVISGVLETQSFADLASDHDNVAVLSFTLLSIVVVQFIVSSLSLPVLKRLEGYDWMLPNSVHRFFSKRNEKKLMSILNELQSHESLPDARVAELQLAIQFMPTTDRVLPTAVGNILRSGEDYPFERFGIPGVRCWPHLWLCLPSHARIAIGARYSELIRSVEGLVWSTLFPIWSFVLPSYWKLMPVIIALFWIHQNYQKVIQSAKSYSSLFRALYDLYRFELYDQLHLPKPISPIDELMLARESDSPICQFLTSIPSKQTMFIHKLNAQNSKLEEE